MREGTEDSFGVDLESEQYELIVLYTHVHIHTYLCSSMCPHVNKYFYIYHMHVYTYFLDLPTERAQSNDTLVAMSTPGKQISVAKYRSPL